MEIYKGQVTTNKSTSKNGTLFAYIPDLGDLPFEVIYTSPYFAANEGGMLAIPEGGAEILIAKDKNKFYYISTIVKPPERFIKGTYDKNYKTIPEKYLYTDRMVPQRISFGDTKGNKLVFDNRYDKKIISSKTQLQSGVGKVLSLNDSPGIDCVILRNEHGDGVYISSEASDVFAAQSVEINSKGSQCIVSRESNIDITVLDGREINVVNKSSGMNSDGITGQYGNINVESENKNISINASNGKIFINTGNSTIQINNEGVTIYSRDKIKLRSLQGIDMQTQGPINMEGTQVNINATAGLVSIIGTSPTAFTPPVPVTTPVGPGNTTIPAIPIPIVETPLQKDDYNKPKL